MLGRRSENGGKMARKKVLLALGAALAVAAVCDRRRF